MRQKVVAGNWKMNTTPAEGVRLAKDIVEQLDGGANGVEVMVFPPFTHLESVREALGSSPIVLGAQGLRRGRIRVRCRWGCLPRRGANR